MANENRSVDWKWQLDQIFLELERRRTVAAMSRPIDDAKFEQFIRGVAVPAFTKFCAALKEKGDVPEFSWGRDWVGIRWHEGHVIHFNALNRAPNRAATIVDRARAVRARYGEPPVDELTDLTEEDMLRWLVISYAAFRRVSEAELVNPNPAA